METFVDGLTTLVLRGDIDRAINEAAAYKESDPLRFGLGMAAIAIAREDPEASRQAAEAAHALDPEHPVGLQFMALARLLQGDKDEAERYARMAVNRDDSLRSRRGLAQILSHTDKLPEAERAFKEILERDPNNLDALLGLGLGRYRRGDNAGALSYFADAYVAQPDDPRAMRNIVRMYTEAGWAVGAIALSRMTRAGSHPAPVNAALDLMAILVTQQVADDFPGKELFGDIDEAVEGLVTSSASLPAAAQLHAARMLFDTGRHEAVRRITDRIAETIRPDGLAASDRGQFEYVLGLLAEESGDEEQALEHYEAAVETDPERWEACTNAVTLLLQAEDASALEDAGRLLSMVPPEIKLYRPQLFFNEAIWLKTVGRVDEARNHLQLLQKMSGGRGRIGELAAEALAELDGNQGGNDE